MFGKKDVSNVHMQKSSNPDTLLRVISTFLGQDITINQMTWFLPSFLQFYKACNKWLKEVDENPEATIEKKKFEGTPEFLSMMKSVSSRLGFDASLDLSMIYIDEIDQTDQHWKESLIGDIDMMYTMCSFDKAWRPKELSPWCAVFSRDDLEVTYHIDLKSTGTMNSSFNAI